MIEQPSRTLVCSIVFLDIVDYSTKPVAEQLLLKQSFNRLLSSSLENVPPRDRVVLDTGDGAGITFLGDPEDALFVAMSLRAAARAETSGSIAVRIGINLGPVRLVKDINGQMNIIGDGINVAQRIMTFAQAGQLLVSRSFYEVVSCLSLDYASLFSYVGARTDKHVREHEVYSVGIGTDAARRVLETGTRRALPRRGTPRLIGELTDIRPFGIHRLALLGAPLAFALLVGGGVAVRAQMSHPPVALEPAPRAELATGLQPVAAASRVLPAAADPQPKAEPTPAPPKVGPAPEAQPPVAPQVRPAPEATAGQPSAAPAKSTVPERAPRREAIPTSRPATRTATSQPVQVEATQTRVAPAPVPPPSDPLVSASAAPAMGIIELSILPWGEVFVDGKSRGVSPPLRSIEVAAGMHTVEIRNTSFPAYTQRVQVRDGEPVRIRHRFR